MEQDDHHQDDPAAPQGQARSVEPARLAAARLGDPEEDPGPQDGRPGTGPDIGEPFQPPVWVPRSGRDPEEDGPYRDRSEASATKLAAAPGWRNRRRAAGRGFLKRIPSRPTVRPSTIGEPAPIG